MSPKVAVIVRTLNRPVLLERALRSVLAQTMQDFTLVVVNDGGAVTAVEAAVSKAGASDDERLVLVRHEKSLGRVAAIHAGLDASDSDYFVLHDDDDTWDPVFLEVTAAHLAANPDVGAAATSTAVVFEELRDGVITETDREWLARDLTEASLVDMVVRNYIPPIALLVRRSVLDTVGRFDATLPVLEDWDFNLRLLCQYPVALITERPLAFWHQRPQLTQGDDSNSVNAEATDHQRLDVVIRDRYLRSDLAGEGTGLGQRLAGGHLHRLLAAASASAHSEAARVADYWGKGHQDQIGQLAQNISLEVGRLRGEVLALREQTENLAAQLAALQPTEPKRGRRG